MRLGVFGVEIDRLSIKSVGVRQTILPGEDVTKIVVRLGVSGIELDRRLVATSGFVVATEPIENLSEIISANRRVGSQSHRPLNEREGGRVVPALQLNHAEQMQRVGVSGLALQYFAITPFRLGYTAGSMLLQREREGLICAELRHGSDRLSPRPAAQTLTAAYRTLARLHPGDECILVNILCRPSPLARR